MAFLIDAQIASIVAVPASVSGRVGRNQAEINHTARTISIFAPKMGTPYDNATSIAFASELAQLFEEKFAQLDLWTYKYHHPDHWLGS